MSKRSKRVLGLLLSIMAVTTVSAAGCFGFGETSSSIQQSSSSGEVSTQKPVITVSGVPTSGIVGRLVSIPAATAMDASGNDISLSVKVTVAGLKENGEVGREFIYNQAANVERSFTPTAAYAKIGRAHV